jgi:hypothetical protein
MPNALPVLLMTVRAWWPRADQQLVIEEMTSDELDDPNAVHVTAQRMEEAPSTAAHATGTIAGAAPDGLLSDRLAVRPDYVMVAGSAGSQPDIGPSLADVNNSFFRKLARHVRAYV